MTALAVSSRRRLASNQAPNLLNLTAIVNRIAGRLSPQVAAAFVDALTRFQKGIDVPALERALAAGNLSLAEAAAGSGRIQAVLLGDPKLLRSLQSASTLTGQAAADALSGVRGVAVSFNATHPNVTLFAREQVAQLVVRVGDDVKEAVRIITALGNEVGLTTAQQARAIREIVGLPPNWARAPINFANELRSGVVNQGRLLHDPLVPGPGQRAMRERTIRQLEAGIAAGRHLDEAWVSKWQSDYTRNLINRRARNIARTETLRAAHYGQREAWTQATEQGVLPRNTRRVWIVTPDERLCVPPRTPVLTLEGWRGISSLKRGDFVLAGDDRFHEVLQTFSRRYDGEMIRLEFGGRSRVKVSATVGHPVMTDQGWMPIEQVGLDTQVRVLAVPCPSGCGRLIPRGPGRAQWCEVCGRTRSVKAAAAPEVRERAIASRRSGAGWDTRSGTPHTEETKRKLSKKAKKRKTPHPFQDPEILRKSLLTQSKRNPYERRVAELLDAQGIEYEAQWPYTYAGSEEAATQGFADFYLPGPRVVLEVDGWRHRHDPAAIEKDELKTAALEREGFTVLRITDAEIDERIEEVGSRIREHCCFTWLTPKRVIRQKVAHQSVHDIEVEGEHNFIAGGVLVHNSMEHAQIPGMNPEGRALTEPFLTPKGSFMDPPIRPNCRCSTALLFPGADGTFPQVAEPVPFPSPDASGAAAAVPGLAPSHALPLTQAQFHRNGIQFDEAGQVQAHPGIPARGDVGATLTAHGVTMTPEEVARRMVHLPDGWEIDLQRFDSPRLGVIELDAVLRAPGGAEAGYLTRRINLGTKVAKHDLLSLYEPYQGTGVARGIMRQQVALYQQLGLREVQLHANLDVGAYAWARYGFTPEQNSWDTLSRFLKVRVADEAAALTKAHGAEAVQQVLAALDVKDPRAIWLVASNPVGKRFLFGRGLAWRGRLVLDDPDAMALFWQYVAQ